MKICYHCKIALDIQGRPGRGEECPFCGADIRICLNCRFYASAANGCREPSAEPVSVKDRANFCEFFEFWESTGSPEDGALKKLKDLFKD